MKNIIGEVSVQYFSVMIVNKKYSEKYLTKLHEMRYNIYRDSFSIINGGQEGCDKLFCVNAL